MARFTESTSRKQPKHEFGMSLFVVIFLMLISAGTVIWQSMSNTTSILLLVFAGVVFAFSVGIFVYIVSASNYARVRQNDEMLKLSRQTFACIQGGLEKRAARKVCELLFPITKASGIVFATKGIFFGYAGFEKAETERLEKSNLRANSCAQVRKSGHTAVFKRRDVDAFTKDGSAAAVIIVPLRIGKNVEGTLEFYYRRERQITRGQLSIADGIGALISTQLSAEALEEQTQLATTMELKALQNQINPHFLFNTINTISSLIRTDPQKARYLLREFAAFYRQTLEDSEGLIMLSREAEQVDRYFKFEVARFGEDRVELCFDEHPGVEDTLVPSFLIQPLVENAVRHGMPSQGKLIVTVSAEINDDGDLVIRVIDNGTGMDEETLANILHPESSTGMGIAVKNVHDRLVGFFGTKSYMKFESELGKGTTVTLVLHQEKNELSSQQVINI